MKNFYACMMKHNLSAPSQTKEWVENDINTLIEDEAEAILSCKDELSELSDEEFFSLVAEKAKEIKDELMKNGIYKNEFGMPMFLYC